MVGEPIRNQEVDKDLAEAPPDFKHYAICGGLLVGPPLLILLLYLMLAGGRGDQAHAGPGAEETTPASIVREPTAREKQEKEITRRVRGLLDEAQALHQRSKSQTRAFYREDDKDAKMAAFRKGTMILRDAQNKLEEASRVDRWNRSNMAIDDLKQLVDRDLHNIMKDKPIYLGD